MKYTLEEVLETNQMYNKYALIFKDEKNKFYIVSDKEYLRLFANKLGFNSETYIESICRVVGNLTNRLIYTMNEDFSDTYKVRIYAQTFGLEVLAGNICRKKYLSLLRNMDITDKNTLKSYTFKDIKEAYQSGNY